MLCYKCINYPTIVWFLSFSSAATAKCHILSRSNGNRSNPPPRPRNPTSQVLRWTTCFRWRKKLLSSTPSPLSRGYTYLNKWKLIHDYQEKQHESLGALESIRNWWYQVKIDRMKIFYLLTLTFRYWQRHIVLALKCLPPIFFNNQASCLLHLPLLSHNLKREYVS